MAKHLISESAVFAAAGILHACPDLFREGVLSRVKDGEDWRPVAVSEFMYLVSLLKHEERSESSPLDRSLSDPGPLPEPPKRRTGR